MKLLSVRQKLVSQPLADIAGEVRRQLDALNLDVPQGSVAITVGSRGISQIPLIIKTTGDWLRQQGADPFIVPSMGSHNGATAEGQQQMVESLGMSESEMGMPIRSSMECVKLASVETGDVWMDRHCYEAEGVLVVNRVKLHTCFSGPVQSGLTKMMVVGMGKIRSAQTFHSSPASQMKNMLLEMGQVLLDSGKILAGLAILEDGFDETAELHGVRSEEILTREPKLIERHREFFPRLPIDELDVLIVVGKTYSGTGMDTNVIGYRGVRGYEDLDRPNIGIIAALSLVEASKGNAIGVGLADFITRRLRNAIDEDKTFLNVYTTGDMERAKIPATLADDETLFEKIVAVARYGQERLMWIPNTLHLDHLYVSEDLGEEIEAHSLCEIDPKPVELAFKDGRHQLDW